MRCEVWEVLGWCLMYIQQVLSSQWYLITTLSSHQEGLEGCEVPSALSCGHRTGEKFQGFPYAHVLLRQALTQRTGFKVFPGSLGPL